MRRGNLLEGIQAGFLAYMQTKQWGQQMQGNKLAQERMRLQNRLNQMQVQNYMSPEEQRQTAYEDWLKRQEHLSGLRAQESEAEREAAYQDYIRRNEYQREQGIGPYYKPPTASKEAATLGKFDPREWEYWNDLALSEGYVGTLPFSILQELSEYSRIPSVGMELARKVIWREVLLQQERNSWIAQLDNNLKYKQLVMQAIWDGLVNQNKTMEQVQADLDEIFKKLVDEGVIKGYGGGASYMAGNILKHHPGFGATGSSKSRLVSPIGGMGGKE